MGDRHGERGTPRSATRITRPYSEEVRPWSPPEAAGSDRDGFPEWLGAYRRNHRLGRGGMGMVYRYRDTKLDRLVAVKTMPRQFAQDPEWRARFEREARTLAALDHPKIAKIYHVIEHEGVDYLILEYVAGTTLAERLAGGRLPVEQALNVAAQVGAAIAAGHAGGIVHQDVKPGNIMITPADSAKLLDYGIAWHQASASDAAATVDDGSRSRARGSRDDVPGRMSPRQAAEVARHLGLVPTSDGSGEEPLSESAPTVSLAGHAAYGEDGAGQVRVVTGTPAYMSPEQTRGDEVDSRADVWSFGCLLYECLTGRRAFTGCSREECIAATLSQEPDFDALPPETPRHVRELIRLCLRKDPDQRTLEMPAICEMLQPAPDRPSTARLRPATPRSLPTQLTSYVCRAGEIDRLQGLLDATRLLTISGAGGSGKTRLAIELGNEVHAADCERERGARFPDGVWFVNLAPLTEADQIPQAVAKVIVGEEGLTQQTEKSETRVLIETIADQELLIILDNCEHIAAGCAAFIQDILRSCPSARAIATSREALEVPGEQVYRVPGLSVPAARPGTDMLQYESVRLFVERATLARPTFRITEGNASAVADICRHLDGMPLALELAAARVRSVPVEALARRLFQVLDPSAVLESSIAWSVNHLQDAEKTLLARLTVFRGGWSLEAVEMVCADDGDATIAGEPIIDLLSQLVDKSLVRYEEQRDRARYHLLETVREYCAQRLVDPGAIGLVRDRQLRFFLDLAREAEAHSADDEQIAWLNRLETEYDNIRAALDHCREESVDPSLAAQLAKALHVFCYVRGYLEENRGALEDALRRRGDAMDLLQAQTANAAGIICERQGTLATAREHYEYALNIVRRLGDERRAAGILTNLGMVAQDMGELEASRTSHRQALAGYEAIGDEFGLAMVQFNLGDVEILAGHYEEARQLTEAAIPVFERQGDIRRIGAALHNLGLVSHFLGEEAAATRFFRESLARTHDLGDRPVAANTLRWLAFALQKRGELERATTLFSAAEVLREGAEARRIACEVVPYEQAVAELRKQMENERFEEAWAEGQAQPIDEILDGATGGAAG